MVNKVNIDTIKDLLDASGYGYDEEVYIIEFIKPFTFKPFAFGKDKFETQCVGWCFSALTKKERDERIKGLKEIQKLPLYSIFEINSYRTSKRKIKELKGE